MSRLRIKTRNDFLDALHAIPFAAGRIRDHVLLDEPLSEYSLWQLLKDLVHEALDEADWPALRALLALYDAVKQTGPRSEMYEASYVAFLEDIRLPTDPAQCREFWRHAPPAFAAAIKKDRGLG